MVDINSREISYMNIVEKVEACNYGKWKNSPELTQELRDWILGNTRIDVTGLSKQSMVFLVRHGHTENPRCYCGALIEFKHNKYRKYCSSKCAATSPTTSDLRKATVIAKYGCENVFQDNSVKAKVKRTNIEKYGSSNPFKIGSDRFKDSMIARHGVENASQLDFVKDKVRKLEWEKTYDNFSRFSGEIVPLFSKSEYIGCGYDKEYSWHCVKCGKDFVNWYHNGCIPKCTHCTVTSKFQDDVEDYLQTIGVSFTTNNRTILAGMEVDVYSSSHNIAIECNGNYWHTDNNGKGNRYHVDKTDKCQASGIRLIHIFEDEWIRNGDIVRSRLRHIFQGSRYRLYGRKCEIREIGVELKNIFLRKYHIQGVDRSSIRLGSFYKGRLVAVMTFGRRRFDGKAGYELIRYATIGSFSCIGVAGKLLKYFERCYEPDVVISYADRRWSEGGVYKALGFEHIHNSMPSYYYVKGDYLTRINRINYQKHKLKDKLPIFNSALTEWENMQANGYDRLWDCGNMVFERYYLKV